MFKLIFAKEDDPDINSRGIFLAGPTRRNSSYNYSWRKDAAFFLDKLGFKGSIYIPEYRDDSVPFDDSNEGLKVQHKWEWKYLEKADIILFWVPRNEQDGMPAYTTNVEFGFWMARCPEKVVLGYPPKAEKMHYLQDLYNNFGGRFDICDSLEETCRTAVEALEFTESYTIPDDSEEYINENDFDDNIEDASY